jgi:hypothetical protein
VDGTGGTGPGSDGRTWIPFAAAGAVVLVIVATTVLLNLGGRSDGFDLATSATIPSGHAADAVIHDGDTVRGSGVVVAARGQPVRFCAPVVTADSGLSAQCRLSVPVTGVDVQALSSRHTAGSTISGLATLTGTYRDGRIAVTEQKPFRTPRVVLNQDQPPCHEPDGGWPSGAADPSAAVRYQRAHPGSIEIVALLHPSARQTVIYVVTNGDPTTVGSALDAKYGDRLCAVAGKYTPEQLRAATSAVTSEVGSGLTKPDTAGAATVDRYGRVLVPADVPMVSAAFAKLVDAQPAGLVQLTVWLRPTG